VVRRAQLPRDSRHGGDSLVARACGRVRRVLLRWKSRAVRRDPSTERSVTVLELVDKRGSGRFSELWWPSYWCISAFGWFSHSPPRTWIRPPHIPCGDVLDRIWHFRVRERENIFRKIILYGKGGGGGPNLTHGHTKSAHISHIFPKGPPG
jgi:hypothetical protein